MDRAYHGGDFTGSAVTGVILGTLAGQCSWTGLYFPLTADLPSKNSRLVLMLREWNGTRYITRDYVNLSEPLIAPVSSPVAVVTPVIAGTKSARKAKKSSRTTTVSINRATEAEFTSVKGLSPSLVQAIIAGRPYARLDDLVKVKGIGPKLLAKIRSRLRLN
jgi:DNA uptake protein ComE-like DNA-binding protein